MGRASASARLLAPAFGGGTSSSLRQSASFARAMAVGEKAEVADAVEAVGQGVQQEAADELVGVERHDLGLAVMAIVLPAEADPAVGQC